MKIFLKARTANHLSNIVLSPGNVSADRPGVCGGALRISQVLKAHTAIAMLLPSHFQEKQVGVTGPPDPFADSAL